MFCLVKQDSVYGEGNDGAAKPASNKRKAQVDPDKPIDFQARLPLYTTATLAQRDLLRTALAESSPVLAILVPRDDQIWESGFRLVFQNH